jgi:RHS repeat-associated protein
MSLAAAAHIGHDITHTSAFLGFVAGAVLGALVVGAAVLFGALTFGLGAVAVLGAAVVVGSMVGELIGENLPAKVKGKIVSGSPNVFINRKNAAYCSSKVDCDDHGDDEQIAQGSGNVGWNSLPAARKDDKGTCGFKVGEGSPNVFVGGPMGGCGLPVGDEVPWQARVIVAVIGLAGGLAGLWSAGLSLASQGICWSGIVARLGVGTLFSVGGGMGMNWLGGALFGEGSTGQKLMNIVGAVMPFRLGMRSRTGRWLAGEPVDVVTGEVVTEQTDFTLPAALPLAFSRYYASGLAFGCYLGPKWANSWGQFITADSTYAYLHTDDGRRIPFELPETDERVRHPLVNKLRLWKTDEGFAVLDAERRTLSFETRVGERLLLSAVTDLNGYRISFAHDARGALTDVLHSGGYRLRVEATPEVINRISLVVDDEREEQLVRYDYDAEGRLAAVYNASGLPMRYEYDAEGRLVRWEDRRGTWFAYEYDAEGRVVRTRGVEGFYSGSFDYDELNLRTAYTDSLGHTTSYTYNDYFQVVRVADARGAITLREYDERDNLLVVTDPNGNTTRYEHDLDGNLIRETDALGNTVSTSYDKRGLPEMTVDEGGKAWQREYDERGNLMWAGDASGVGLRYERDARGNAVKVIDALDNSCEFGHDARGLVVWATDWKGNRTAYRRDAAGRVVERTDPLGRGTEAEYHVADKPSRVRLPTGAELRWDYDAEGNLVRYRDANGREHRYEYGRFDLLISERKPDGTRRRYRYDTEGRLVAVANEHGVIYRFELDEAGRKILERDFSGRELRFDHDAAGNVVRRVNGAGQATDFELDALGRITRKATEDGAVTVFEYDAYGNIVRAQNPACVVELERDDCGRVVRETQNGRAVESEYDALGLRLKRRVSHGQEFDFAYDANGQLIEVSAAVEQQPALTFAYDALGREVSRETDDGCRYRQSYDALGRVVEQSAQVVPPTAREARQAGRETVGARAIAGRRYRYDQAANPVAVEDQLWGATEYEYDANEQVVRVLHRGRAAEGYEYDATGQLAGGGAAQKTHGARRETPTAMKWERDEGGRLHRTDRAEYRYDAEGRVVSKIEHGGGKGERRWRYEWDAEGRLRELVTPRGERWRYEYDGFGRRIAKRSDAGGVEYVWDGDVVAEEIRPAGSDGGTYAQWMFEPQSFVPLFKQRDGDTFYCLADQAGTPRELVTTDGRVAWAARQSLWGEIEEVGAQAVDCPVRFQGQWYDEESELHYNWHRHYDAHAGGYYSPDPIGLAGGINPYGYVPNPLAWIDPFGLESCRLQYMGRTPGKSSRTGQDVISRMRSEGNIRGSGAAAQFRASDGNWYPLREADMAHRIDAVSWWNNTGRNFGAKSPLVRQFMLEPNNYTLDHFSLNRSAGASLGQTYLPPVPRASPPFTGTTP